MSKHGLDEILDKWSTRTSLLQFFASDLWQIPIVKDWLAPAGGTVVLASALSDQLRVYATAVTLGAVMYIVIWARLNLPRVMASAYRALEDEEALAENSDEAILSRKRALSALF